MVLAGVARGVAVVEGRGNGAPRAAGGRDWVPGRAGAVTEATGVAPPSGVAAPATGLSSPDTLGAVWDRVWATKGESDPLATDSSSLSSSPPRMSAKRFWYADRSRVPRLLQEAAAATGVC